VARAPLDEIEAFKSRMGWQFRWVSSFGSDFNYDFDVSFTPEQIKTGKAFYNYRDGTVPLEDLSGISIFYKNDKGEIFHTYSAFGRGAEEVAGSYVLLEGAQRARAEFQSDRLGASSRSLRFGWTCERDGPMGRR
jgi:predicted dithiol-disulfide oxidoreductase (DUF899 family)